MQIIKWIILGSGLFLASSYALADGCDDLIVDFYNKSTTLVDVHYQAGYGQYSIQPNGTVGSLTSPVLLFMSETLVGAGTVKTLKTVANHNVKTLTYMALLVTLGKDYGYLGTLPFATFRNTQYNVPPFYYNMLITKDYTGNTDQYISGNQLQLKGDIKVYYPGKSTSNYKLSHENMNLGNCKTGKPGHIDVVFTQK